MFRVSPVSEIDNGLEEECGPGVADYDIVQLTMDLPIWLLLVSTVKADGRTVASRFQLSSLADAIGFGSESWWTTSELFEHVPARLSKDGIPALVRVLEIWEAAPNEVFQPSYEVVTALGVQMLSGKGQAMPKSNRGERVWPPSLQSSFLGESSEKTIE